MLKAEIRNPAAGTLVFPAQKTMYGGREIAEGDEVFLFASENEGGAGLVARGVVSSAQAVDKIPGLARQTPRVTITVRPKAPGAAWAGLNSSPSPPGPMDGPRRS